MARRVWIGSVTLCLGLALGWGLGRPVPPRAVAPELPSDPTADPGSGPASDPVSGPAPDAPPAPQAPSGPRVDALRVERDRSALVSGRAVPGEIVEITLSGATVGSVRAGADGSFVLLLGLPDRPGARRLALRSRLGDGTVLAGADTFLLELSAAPAGTGGSSPRAAPKPEPKLLRLDPEGVEVVQGGVSDGALSVETIRYDAEGRAVLGGSAPGATRLRAYLDGSAVKAGRAAPDGRWRLNLPTLEPRTYRLRVEQIGTDGAVAARVETPFRPASPARRAAAAAGMADGIGRITVQPGATLWAIAEGRYGDGLQFIRVFDANSGRIRNPDLIYPGQVFELPD